MAAMQRAHRRDEDDRAGGGAAKPARGGDGAEGFQPAKRV
jgi:hypothetical protein